MVRSQLATLVAAGTVALAGCSSDHATAPVSAVALASVPLIGDTPTNHLIGEVPTITYSAADGGFTIKTALNNGLLKASQRGEANFSIATTLTLRGAGGDGIVIVNGCPLSDVKVDLADPRPDPVIEFFVPWDGKNSDGSAMSGNVQVSYSMGIVQNGGSGIFEPNNDAFMGGGAVSGIVIVILGDNLQLIGEVSTSNLVGDTPGITYSAVDGGFTVRLAVRAGLLEASQRGQANFAIETTLTLQGVGGDGIIIIGGCPLSDVKVDLADPRPDPIIEFFVPWNGKSSDGNSMTGKVSVSYSLDIVQNRNSLFGPDEPSIIVGPGPVTGFLDIFLD